MILETPSEFTKRIRGLEQLAYPPAVNKPGLSSDAKVKAAGMTCREALELVIREEHGGAD